jgi:fibrillarin-like rRNA methylase
MSRYEVSNEQGKIVYGWDQMLNSFYLHIHDFSKPEDENPIVWLGSSGESILYNVSDLVREARSYGIEIGHAMQRTLYRDKDEGI